MLKESKKATLRYLSLEKFKSILKFTLTSFIVKTFSSLKLFSNVISRKMVAVKKIKIYPFTQAFKCFDNN